jgi:hypothetical protein
LHSKYDYTYLIRQGLPITTQLLRYARNNEIEQRAWEKWLGAWIVSQFSKNSNLQDFESYFRKIHSRECEVHNNVDYNEIMAKAEKTKARHQRVIRK